MADAPAFRIWPPVAFGVPFLAGVALTQWLGDPASLAPARAFGWIFVGLALPWDAWALLTLRRHRTALLPGRPTTQLVTTGPYAFSRNPLYVGFVLWHLGLALLLGSLWALAALPVAVLAVTWGAILPEETYLAGKFGPAYAQYRVKVRRWL